MPDAAQLDYWLKLFQLVGIPVAIVVYWLNKRRERIDREYGTYNALDEKYIEYLALCAQHPELDVSDVPRATQDTLSADQQQRELIMFSILVSIMERAYLMYKDKSDRVRRVQWEGWNSYIHDWCRRPNFAKALPNVAQQFDSQFSQYLLSVAAQQGAKAR